MNILNRLFNSSVIHSSPELSVANNNINNFEDEMNISSDDESEFDFTSRVLDFDIFDKEPQIYENIEKIYQSNSFLNQDKGKIPNTDEFIYNGSDLKLTEAVHFITEYFVNERLNDNQVSKSHCFLMIHELF